MEYTEKQDYALVPGTVLRGKSYDYVIRRTLGAGACGITYLAAVRMRGELGSLVADMFVAVKEFFMSGINGREGTAVTVGSQGGLCDDYRRKFIREAGTLSRLKHEGIVKVVEAFEANRTAYYVMEYISGGSLDDYIKRNGGIGEAECLALTRQIGSALDFMHANRMLHLDLKPGNSMRRESGDVVLIDFGLSKHYGADGRPESSTKIGGGTPGYAPVEQANYHDGKDFPVTMDIYALGATMFKMLTGRCAPEASDLLNDGFPDGELVERHVGDRTRSIIARAMSPLKKDRYQSVGELLEAMGKKRDGVGSAFADKADEITEVEIFNEKESTIFEHRQPASNADFTFSKVKVRPLYVGIAAIIIIMLVILYCLRPWGNDLADNGISAIPEIQDSVLIADSDTSHAPNVINTTVQTDVVDNTGSHLPNSTERTEQKLILIDGRVTDKVTGEPVSGAVVRTSNGRKTTTNQSGRYSLDGVKPKEKVSIIYKSKTLKTFRPERGGIYDFALSLPAKAISTEEPVDLPAIDLPSEIQSNSSEEEASGSPIASVSSASEEESSEINIIYTIVEESPEFPGGEAAMMRYIANNLKYPSFAQENGIQGRVTLSFVIERDGSITNIEARWSPDEELSKEASV